VKEIKSKPKEVTPYGTQRLPQVRNPYHMQKSAEKSTEIPEEVGEPKSDEKAVRQPKFCGYCGEKVPNNAKFCPSCGSKV
jgi:hypothetical protein